MNSVKGIHEYINNESQFFKFGFDLLKGDYELWLKHIKKPVEDYLRNSLIKYNSKYILNSLSDYHNSFKANNNDHHLFIKKISRYIPEDVIDRKNEYLINAEDRLGSLFKKKLKLYQNRIEFRVVRPNQPDNNLLHRDHWFPYFKGLLNLYIPLCGSTFSSVLRIVPESHHWNEEDVVPTFFYNEGKRLGSNGILYSTPTIKECTKELNIHRPDVLEGDLMYFSPMIIHGGGSNNNSDDTRFSLELRLEIV